MLTQRDGMCIVAFVTTTLTTKQIEAHRAIVYAAQYPAPFPGKSEADQAKSELFDGYIDNASDLDSVEMQITSDLSWGRTTTTASVRAEAIAYAEDMVNDKLAEWAQDAAR